METKDDKYWVARCQSGDENGYTVLYTRYARPIYNAIFRLVRNADESEDLLQETFIAVFSEIDKLGRIEQVGAWIRRIAMNRSISHLRRKKMSFEVLEEESLASNKWAIDVQQDQEQSIVLDCRIEELQRALDQLPEVHRTIVVLHAFEGMSHKEIGQQVGLSEIAVRVQYHRAKKMILKQLKAYPDDKI